MTLRIVTYDDTKFKIVPIEPTEEMSQAYYASQRNYGFWNFSPVYFDIIKAAPNVE